MIFEINRGAILVVLLVRRENLSNVSTVSTALSKLSLPAKLIEIKYDRKNFDSIADIFHADKATSVLISKNIF